MTPHFFPSAAASVPLPDLSVLSGLSPGVAYAALGTIVLVTLLFHFGGPLRERLSRKPPEKPETPTPTTAAALPAAVDTASRAHEAFIAHLQQEITALRAEREQTVNRLIQERNEARRQLETLQAENYRLHQMLWRGPA